MEKKEVMLPCSEAETQLLISGRRTIIPARKRPKIRVPFTVYLLEIRKQRCGERNGDPIFTRTGLVVGEFKCPSIDDYWLCGYTIKSARYMRVDEEQVRRDIDYRSLFMTEEALHKFGKGATIHGWHVSELKCYEEPLSLDDFRAACPHDGRCARCEYLSAGEDPNVAECCFWATQESRLDSLPTWWRLVKRIDSLQLSNQSGGETK